MLASALKRHEPWLEWSGKQERPWFVVDPVALHMHERVSTQAILRVLARDDPQRDLFADPQLDYAKAVQFYQHDVDWTNRMILGDALQVMASLARREDLAGKVQMIYIDPPYGINFRSNFQPQIGQRDVKDRQQDLTREPEMVKAYRDTWTLGIHSYLAYLRDRLAMARELLSDTGSIFVQINDTNLHFVRSLLDETFGAENFVSNIAFATTTGFSSNYLSNIADFVIWYAKDLGNMRFIAPYREKVIGQEGASKYKPLDSTQHELSWAFDVSQSVSFDQITAQGETASDQEFEMCGRSFTPPNGMHWKTTVKGLERLRQSGRLRIEGRLPRYARLLSDFSVSPLANVWTDIGGVQNRVEGKLYAVQTAPEVIKRCMLMTTDAGDLVLDPTCGSGTTAYVAEQWGRRWIMIDTSRVALTLAKHRLMTARFDYYRLRELNAEDVQRNPKGPWISGVETKGRPTGAPMTFQCKTVPHIMLGDIARNTSLDLIFERHEPVLSKALGNLNVQLAKVSDKTKGAMVDKLVRKHREEGANAVTDGDIRRWLLPGTQPALVKPAAARPPLKGLTRRQAERYQERIPPKEWREWEVPFDVDADWPQQLCDALVAYRSAWRNKMDEVNENIAANSSSEELVDKPEVVADTIRVAGAFTMEGVIAKEEGPDCPIGGAPEELEVFDGGGDMVVANAEAHLDKMIRLLRTSGVDFSGNKNMKFASIVPMAGPGFIHAEGEWESGLSETRRVAVSIGPEVGNLSSMQVEDAVRNANRAGYDEVVFAGFGFDAAAQEAIEGASHRNLRLHMALIRPDVAMDDLLKTQPGSQIFTVFSAPRVTGPVAHGDDEYTVGVEGMDVYDPVSGALHPTDKQRIAAWFLDTDYDGRTFCICQAFFPDRRKWDRLARALNDLGLVERGAFDALSGWESLPFPRPAARRLEEDWRVAVKVIDPRGNEGLRVLTVGGAA